MARKKRGLAARKTSVREYRDVCRRCVAEVLAVADVLYLELPFSVSLAPKRADDASVLIALRSMKALYSTRHSASL